MNKQFTMGAMCLVAVVLAGCGGGSKGGDASPPPAAPALAAESDIPQSATTETEGSGNTASALAFVRSTKDTTSDVADAAEPMRTGNGSLRLASSDSEEPADL